MHLWILDTSYINGVYVIRHVHKIVKVGKGNELLIRKTREINISYYLMLRAPNTQDCN